MPVHVVPADALDSFVTELERAGAEDVTHIAARGDEFVVVTRKRYTPRFETRAQ